MRWLVGCAIVFAVCSTGVCCSLYVKTTRSDFIFQNIIHSRLVVPCAWHLPKMKFYDFAAIQFIGAVISVCFFSHGVLSFFFPSFRINIECAKLNVSFYICFHNSWCMVNGYGVILNVDDTTVCIYWQSICLQSKVNIKFAIIFIDFIPFLCFQLQILYKTFDGH